MEFIFKSYVEFLDDFAQCPSHECINCRGNRELSIAYVDVQIADRKMHFKDLLVLVCTECNAHCLPMNSKKMIGQCYNIMVKEGRYLGEMTYAGYREKFNYCEKHDFLYDHRDYYNIPGLYYGEDNSTKGFLTPVYFTKKVLLYFMQDQDYLVKLGAETFGHFYFKNNWMIPFGINRNGKVVFWLGDLNDLDDMTLSIMMPHNVDSDHQLIGSEFYAAQMCCIWSQPNREIRICDLKNEVFNKIKNSYGVCLFHLEDEIEQQKDKYVKPVIYTEKTIEPTIQMLHKVLIEGVNIKEFRNLYLQTVEDPNIDFKKWKSIKFYESLLKLNIKDGDDVRDIISPLYILNDFRQYYDHLLSIEKKNTCEKNILQSLNVTSFNEVEEIYNNLLDKLIILFSYLNLGYGE